MSKSISDLKVDLQGALGGTNLNRVQGLNELLYRAAGDFLLDIDPAETLRLATLDNPIYDEAEDFYTFTDVPEDLKGTRISYFAPKDNPSPAHNSRARYSKEFYLRREKNTFVIDSGAKTLRLATNSDATEWEMEYYSKYLCRTSDGTWQETVTDDENLINLDTESYGLYFDKVMILLAARLRGEDSAFDVSFYEKHYEKGLTRYTAQNKSQAMRPQSTYYRTSKTRR